MHLINDRIPEDNCLLHLHSYNVNDQHIYGGQVLLTMHQYEHVFKLSLLL